MDKTDILLKSVAEVIYEEEGSFFLTIHADEVDLPLEGLQRLVMGGDATPCLIIADSGIQVSLSINRVHYDVHIPWIHVAAVEGNNKAFFCKRDGSPDNKGDSDTQKSEKKRGHLKVVK
ncbi:MAG: hypothetical protein OEV42_18980 [Deltaproteobacteria bacterium]|nr:hypothetical protein [Deltaproteobacteria bacterium]